MIKRLSFAASAPLACALLSLAALWPAAAPAQTAELMTSCGGLSGLPTGTPSWRLYENLKGELCVAGDVNTTDAGTKINAATMPAGGVGLTGWESAIWYELTVMDSGHLAAIDTSAAHLPAIDTNAAHLPAIDTSTAHLPAIDTNAAHLPAIDTSTAAISATTGAAADAAWSGSGSGTLSAVSKAIWTKLEAIRTVLVGTLTVSGTVTANAGTNLNTSALALEAGHAATIDTSTAAISATTGAAADAAWSGSGSGTLSAVSKAIWTKLEAIRALVAGTLTVSGSVTATPVALTPVTASTALESNHVLKGSAGTFHGAQVNTGASTVWVMLFNLTSLPANGAVTPLAWWQVSPNTTAAISESPAFTMSTGITIGCSTTGPFVLTASPTCTFGGGQVQ